MPVKTSLIVARISHILPIACLVLLPTLGLGLAAGMRPDQSKSPPIDFNRDIRPILSENCFKCHGPDPGNRQGNLRLDRKEDAFAKRTAGAPVVPVSLAASRIWIRINDANPALRMPPPNSGKTLTARQKDVIRTWILQGAKWSVHWAFIAPQRPKVPTIDDGRWTKGAGHRTSSIVNRRTNTGNWCRNPIDAFILARLLQKGLTPSPEADKITLLRRLSLDLIGLPPTPQEVDAFLADRRPDSYERQVDRLLASPHYGERWGRHWLDAARYADSDGFEKDKPRPVWFYRDWVIDALNRDLPYDRFVIDQIAGDLLPNATQEQIVATGFLRNSMLNEEGGVDPEQFRMEAMFDRMDAIGKSVLGLTIQCAQCHSHKYDPLTQEEYYRIFAFLNNSYEANVAVYTPADQMKRAEIFRRIHEIEATLQHEHPDWQQRMAAWEREVSKDQAEWRVIHADGDISSGQRLEQLADGSILAQSYAPTKHTGVFTARLDSKPVTAVRLELLNDPNLPRGGPGRSIYGLCALTEFKVEAAPADHPDATQSVKVASATADVNPPEKELEPIFDDRSKKRRVTGPIEYAIDGKDETAWGLDAGPGRNNVPRKAVFVLEKPVSFPQGTILTIRLVQNHGGWNSDDNQNNNLGRFRLSVTSAQKIAADPLPAQARGALAIPADRRTPAHTSALFDYWRTTVPDWKDANAEIERLWREHPEPATQFVLSEREMPRTTSVLQRGDFLKPVKAVEPGVPAFLHPLPANAARNRLSFARWLVDPRSPTTARSIVNRIWQTYFGKGIVRTSEDLGTQSEAPSHRELLDWLAMELMKPAMDDGRSTIASKDTVTRRREDAANEHDRRVSASPRLRATNASSIVHRPSSKPTPWSLKHIHRLVVTSATYRQSSKVTPEQYAADPDNRLLARGPRFRVEGEVVRDIALAASGLLNPKVGGPSVYPPAPDFLFQPPASYGPKIWKTSTGPDRYRRGLYAFRYRSVPYPVLQNFDAPNGDFSCVRRGRSNTPLQALTTLNEPTFVECAQALALKTVREGGQTDVDRLTFAVRRCLARKPSAKESGVLLDVLDKNTKRFKVASANPWAIAAPDPKSRPELPPGITPAQLAGWTVVARVLLNLDETITKE